MRFGSILCTGGLDVIRKDAWSFYRTISGVRLCWELEEPKGPKGRMCHIRSTAIVASPKGCRLQGHLAHKKHPPP